MKVRHYLLLGVVASLSAHAAIPMLLRQEDAARIAASSGASVAVVGSLEDLVARSTAETAEPLETEARETEPTPAAETVAVAQSSPTPAKVTALPQPVSPGVTETREPADVRGGVANAVSTVETVAAAPATEARPVSPDLATDLPPDSASDPVRAAEPVNDTLRPPKAGEVVAAVVAPPSPLAKPAVPQHARTRERSEKARPRKTRQASAGAPVSSRRGTQSASRTRSQAVTGGRADGRSDEAGAASLSNYKGKVLSRLHRAKRYPPKARRRQLEGTAVLRFTVSSDGRVSGGRIVGSSGETLLDAATMAALRRASPMPRFPSAMGGRPLTFRVPLRFEYR